MRCEKVAGALHNPDSTWLNSYNWPLIVWNAVLCLSTSQMGTYRIHSRDPEWRTNRHRRGCQRGHRCLFFPHHDHWWSPRTAGRVNDTAIQHLLILFGLLLSHSRVLPTVRKPYRRPLSLDSMLKYRGLPDIIIVSAKNILLLFQQLCHTVCSKQTVWLGQGFAICTKRTDSAGTYTPCNSAAWTTSVPPEVEEVVVVCIADSTEMRAGSAREKVPPLPVNYEWVLEWRCSERHLSVPARASSSPSQWGPGCLPIPILLQMELGPWLAPIPAVNAVFALLWARACH